MFAAPYPPDAATLDSNIISYWVIPPPENKPHDYGKPMVMTYNVVQDPHLSSEALSEIVSSVST